MAVPGGGAGPFGSIQRLAQNYRAITPGTVMPTIALGGPSAGIAGANARQRTVDRGGPATVSRSTLPDPQLGASAAGDYDPTKWSRDQLALNQDIPGRTSAYQTNPTGRFQREAAPCTVGDLMKDMQGSAAADHILPLPIERELCFLYSQTDNIGPPGYAVPKERLVDRLHLNSDQRNRLSYAPGVISRRRPMYNVFGRQTLNYFLTEMELQTWKAAKSQGEYYTHLMNEPAASTFLSMFTLDGAVVHQGMAGNQGGTHTRTGGSVDTKLLDITTFGEAYCLDYSNGYGNTEGASVNMVIYRAPIKADSKTVFNLGWNNATQHSYSYEVNFKAKSRAELGPYADVMYPIQVDFVFHPDGSDLPGRYTSPMYYGSDFLSMGSMIGAKSFRIGTLFNRNIGNPGEHRIPQFSMYGPAALDTNYRDLPRLLGGLPRDHSTKQINDRRPLKILLNGDPY